MRSKLASPLRVALVAVVALIPLSASAQATDGVRRDVGPAALTPHVHGPGCGPTCARRADAPGRGLSQRLDPDAERGPSRDTVSRPSGGGRATPAATRASLGRSARPDGPLGDEGPLVHSVAPGPRGQDPVADGGASVRASPTLAREIARLQGEGWRFVYGSAGYFTDHATRTVTISADPADPLAIAQQLAHEVGHVVAGPAPHVYRSGMTRGEYVRENTRASLEGEAAAFLHNWRVRNEALARGVDFGLAGAGSAAYSVIAADPSLSPREKIRRIGALWGIREVPSVGGRNYEEYYASFFARAWDDYWGRSQ